MMKITNSILALAASLFLVLADPGYAEGLLGGAIKGIGRATGIKPIEDLGRNADEEHRRIKEHNPDYKAVEEGATELVKRPFTIACTIPYQTITNAVIAKCSNWDGRLNDQDLIGNAINILLSNGIFHSNDFDGIQIRWCPLSGAHGMAPDRGRIYLDTSHKQDSDQDLAVLLAHEMKHVMQYRLMGTDNFKCEYSRKYIECGSCQDNGHPLEREAYAFENSVAQRLSTNIAPQYAQPSYYQSSPAPPMPQGIPVRYCQTQLGTCSIPPAMAPMGTPCFCNNAYGQQIPGSAF
jgi:hypothetical protein